MAKQKGHEETIARHDSGLTVTFEPRGPQQAVIESLSRELQQHPSVQNYLRATRNRLLSLDLLESGLEVKGAHFPAEPNRFSATFYDYTNNRVIRATGD